MSATHLGLPIDTYIMQRCLHPFWAAVSLKMCTSAGLRQLQKMTCCAVQGLGDGLEGLEGLTQSLANLGNSQSMLAYDPFGATDTQVYTFKHQDCMISTSQSHAPGGRLHQLLCVLLTRS